MTNSGEKEPETEPVVSRTVVAMIVTGILAALAHFGIHLSAGWQQLLDYGVTVVVFAVLAWRVRRAVDSPATVRSRLLAARGSNP